MGSKFMKFSLITTVIINIIFFILYLKNGYVIELNDFLRAIGSTIYFYNLLISTVVDVYISYEAHLIFYIVVNISFLSIIIGKKYNILLYFLYIITNMLLILPLYLDIFSILIYSYTFEIIGNLRILNIIFSEIIIDHFFTHIIFFFEVVLPIIYFRNYKLMLKN